MPRRAHGGRAPSRARCASSCRLDDPGPIAPEDHVSDLLCQGGGIEGLEYSTAHGNSCRTCTHHLAKGGEERLLGRTLWSAGDDQGHGAALGDLTQTVRRTREVRWYDGCAKLGRRSAGVGRCRRVLGGPTAL